ncbi:MAG: glycosyltransferase [Dorea sp.]|nr:glycosyltransferase [Dorea sp.]
MKQPLVSIVMVNRNKEKYLDEAIKSVLEQTYKNWELILVDDCSTDTSVNIIKKYEDVRIKPVFLEKNVHICKATNMGLDLAKGRYIARLDSDDFWRKDKLEKQVNLFENHAEVKVCFTKLDLVNKESEIINDSMKELYDLYNSRQKSRIDWIRFFFFVGNSLIQSSMMYRKELLDEVGGFKLAYMQCHDFEFFVRLIMKCEFTFIEEPLLAYRRTQTQNSMVHPENDSRFFNEYMNIRRHFFDDMPDALFGEAFRDYFLNADAVSHEEFLCEQAFLLRKCVGWTEKNPILGMMRLADLFENKEIEKILSEKYSYTPKDFYAQNSVFQYYEEEKIQKLEKELQEAKTIISNQEDHIRVLLDVKDNQQKYIENMQNSASWKMTKPLRTVKEKIEKKG